MHIHFNPALKKLAELLSPTEVSVLSALVYYDIFRYPLTKAEITKLAHYYKSDSREIHDALLGLEKKKLVVHRDNFYQLRENESEISRRLNGNKMAEQALKRSQKYSRLISHFPFVKAVWISGSLSKGVMDKNSDIDYFIITEPGKLWISRTLLILFKKIFLFNSRRNFCLNYFIDSKSLEIQDRNIFTSTEILSLLPVYNAELFHEFVQANKWSLDFFPNNPAPIHSHYASKPVKYSLFKKSTEALINFLSPKKIDSFCFNLTLRFWKKKFKDYDKIEFETDFKSRKNISKHHPGSFQKKVLKAYDEKFSRLLLQMELKQYADDYIVNVIG